MMRPCDITGVVLAGGQGSRMGGVDKGRQLFLGEPLAERALKRLAPQVGAVMISANRHLEAYRALCPVVEDTMSGFPGPLAGILAALRASTTPYLACVPCDAPFFPMDVVARLAAALENADTLLATAAAPDPDDNGRLRSHPVFALMHCSLADSLEARLLAGERRLNTWRTHHNAAEVIFADGRAFYNVNTLQALARAH